MKTKSSIVYSLVDFGNLYFSDLDNVFNRPYTFESNGFIITNYQLGEGSIDFNVTRRVPTTILDYDYDLNEIVKKTISIYTKFHITIITDLGICLLWGNLQTFNVFKSICRREFTPIIFKNVSLTPNRIFEIIRDSDLRFTIEKLILDDYSPMEGILGKYACYVNSNQNAVDLILESKANITYLQLQVYSGSGDFFQLYISSNGVFGIKDFEDSKLTNIVTILKIIIL